MTKLAPVSPLSLTASTPSLSLAVSSTSVNNSKELKKVFTDNLAGLSASSLFHDKQTPMSPPIFSEVLSPRQKKAKIQSLYTEIFEVLAKPNETIDLKNWGNIWNLKKLQAWIDNTLGFADASENKTTSPKSTLTKQTREQQFFILVDKIEALGEFDPNYHFTVNTSQKTNLLALSIKNKTIFLYLLKKGANNTSPVITTVAGENYQNQKSLSLIKETEKDTILVALIKNLYPLATIEQVLALPTTNINYQNERGDSALHVLCALSEDLRSKLNKDIQKNYFTSLLELLHKYGAHLTLRNKVNNISALELALQNKNDPLVASLVNDYQVLAADIDQVYLKVFENRMGGVEGISKKIEECLRVGRIQSEKNKLVEQIEPLYLSLPVSAQENKENYGPMEGKSLAHKSINKI